jgi:hypothetical protein
MAFLVKNVKRVQGSSTPVSVIDQNIKVSVPAVALPATTTGQLFRVKGGRVLVKAIVGEVTTIIQTQACNLKVSSKALSNASAAVGTAVDIAANVDITAREVGGFAFVEGDGTALVLSNAGGAFIGPNSGYFVAPQGEIYLTTSATNTGAMKWDLWYQPLDAGAYVEPVPFTAAGILQAAI